MATTPTIAACRLTTQNWVITCATEVAPSLARRHWALQARRSADGDGDGPVPWSRWARFRRRQRGQSARGRWLCDYHGADDSMSISKPVGGLYHGPVDPAQRTNFAINLQEAAVRMRHLGVQYNPVRIHALIMKFRRPSAAVLVFSAGRIVCTGAKTQARAVFLLNVMTRMLREHGYPGLRIKPGSWAVQNVVASARVPARINIRRLYEANRQYCTYDPDIFPGVPFRKPLSKRFRSDPRLYGRARPPLAGAKGAPAKSKITILVFDTGSLVITGAKSEFGLRAALEDCLDDIWAARVRPRKRQRRNTPPPTCGSAL